MSFTPRRRAQRGADAFIGRRLTRMLDTAGFADVDSSLVQPYGRSGEIKQISSLTFAAISDAVVASKLATAEEVARLKAELQAFAARPDTTLALPRIFQAWGRKPSRRYDTAATERPSGPLPRCSPRQTIAQQRRKQVRQVLGDQARTEARAGLGMQPDRGAGRLEGRHALRQQAGGDAGEHVAGAGGGQPGRGVGVDRGAAVGRRDHCVGPLEDDGRLG